LISFKIMPWPFSSRISSMTCRLYPSMSGSMSGVT
jgi:hypothetical protein